MSWQPKFKDDIEQATRLNHRAVFIHPFLNGNGRWARLLANIILAQNRLGFVDWPEQGIVDSSSPIRSKYMDSLRHADEGDLIALQQLHEKYWKKSLD